MNTNFYNKLLHKHIFLLFFLLISSFAMAQTTLVKGTVVDAETKSAIPFATIYFSGTGGVVADSSGQFQLATDRKISELEVTYIGYAAKKVAVIQGKEQSIVIELNVDASKDLNAVVVKSKRKIKYTNKNNPAVELIRNVIANKKNNMPERYNFVEFEQYEKVQLSLARPVENLNKSKLLKKFDVLLANTDTTKIKGKALTPVYLEEKIVSNYYRKDPEQNKKVVEGEKKVNFGALLDSAGLSSYLKRIYEDVNVYENNISLFKLQFLSPIADMAPAFYMFFIRDTIIDNEGNKLVKLYFTPRNTNDFLFRGTMFITLDGTYAVQKLDMTLSPNINMNWVRKLEIHQAFEKNTVDGRYHLLKSDLLSELSVTKGKPNSIYGERSVSYKNFAINHPREESFYSNATPVHPATDSFWLARRHQPLTGSEANVYRTIDTLKTMRSYKRLVDIVSLTVAGYKSFGKFEIGPASTFYSWNPVEGFRLRFGGRTTPELSKRLYFETYGAYGFRDEAWKGFFSFTYSLNNKSVYSFPLNYIRASAQRETKIPGQELQFVQEDNLLLSIKRGENNKWLYNDIYRLDYVKEFDNHLSIAAGLKNWKQTPAGTLSYVKGVDQQAQTVADLTTTELSLQVRWAPNEQFYQGKIYRIPIINRYPIFNFSYTRGIKGLLGAEYNYDKFNLSVEKRVYLSQFGFTDVVVEGSLTNGKLPYPLLSIHRANQTYAYQLYSYNLMNFLEFVSDKYVSVNLDHSFNGFIFNRIPLLNKLNLREIITAKILYGAVRPHNNPANNSSLYNFPSDDKGQFTTFTLNDGPYVEGSVGVGNIFKLLRLDLVKRFTYLDNRGVAEWGIRGRMKLDF